MLFSYREAPMTLVDLYVQVYFSVSWKGCTFLTDRLVVCLTLQLAARDPYLNNQEFIRATQRHYPSSRFTIVSNV